ncbi:MAG: alpha/beta hydrolase [Holophagales bacterium]|nr:alpha/beta hydrolase [Holophagales bacterium]
MGYATREVVNLETTTVLYKELFEVRTRDDVRLIVTRKRPVERARDRTPVLLVHGLGQNRFTWDLSRRSMMNYLVSEGFEVYNVELRGHGLSRANGSPYPKEFDDYVDSDLPALIDFVRRLSRCERVFLVGHSLGATIFYAAAPEQQPNIRGLVSIAGPCHLGRGVPLLQGLAKVLGLLQRVRAEALLPDYFLVDLIGVLASPAIHLIDHPWNRVLDHIWLPGSIERDILLERVGRGFDRTGTAVIGIMVRWANSGEFHDANRERDFEEQLKEVDVPALFVTGDRDTAVPWPSVEEAFRNLRGPDKTGREFGMEKDGAHFRHCDLICGREAPRVVWPVIGEWLKERDVPDRARKPSPKRAKEAPPRGPGR